MPLRAHPPPLLWVLWDFFTVNSHCLVSLAEFTKNQTVVDGVITAISSGFWKYQFAFSLLPPSVRQLARPQVHAIAGLRPRLLTLPPLTLVPNAQNKCNARLARRP